MFDRNLLKIPGMKGVLCALLFLCALQAGTIIGQAIALSTTLAALWDSRPFESQAYNVCLFLIFFSARRILVFAQDSYLDRYSTRQAELLRASYIEATLCSSNATKDEDGIASLVTTANQGIDDVQDYLRIVPSKIVGILAISAPVLVCVFMNDFISGIILLVMLPVIFFFMTLLGSKARDKAEAQYRSYLRLSNHFLDTLRGMDTVVSSGAIERCDEDVYESSEKLRSATLRTMATATLSGAVLDLAATFGIAAVAIMLAFRIMDSTTTLYVGFLALILSPEFFAPIQSFANDYHASLNGKNALMSVLERLETSEIETCSRNSKTSSETQSDKTSREGRLVFENVSFDYVHGQSAIENASFELKPGEHVALIGSSGAGKSTIAKLAAGLLQPTSGTVTAENVRLIPQKPHIIRASVLDNARLYYPDASLEDTYDVLELVGLGDFVNSLPNGIDTFIGEGNTGMSGGQAHRLALARALLDRKSKILVFDEPTAQLDIETELELKDQLLALIEGRTVLMVTHRLHWTIDMDRTLVIADGLVSERDAL